MGITREVLQALSPLHRQPRLIVQTRSPLVTRDIDLLEKFKSVRVNMTIATDDDVVRQEFEPACASIDRRYAALEELKVAGITIGVSISPLLPLTNVKAFAARLCKFDPDTGFVSTFHQTTFPFASNTPPLVVAKAREMGWTPIKEQMAIRYLEETVPALRKQRLVRSA